MSVFKLPDLGEGLAEAEIQAWSVVVGDTVKQGETLLEVETDKAIVDIPSPHDGEIVELCVAVGDIVPVNSPLCVFAGGATDSGDTDAFARKDQGSVVGRMQARQDDKQKTRTERPRALPAVRALARRQGIDLQDLSPSGQHGEVTRADVENAASGPAGPMTPLKGVRRAMARKMTIAHRDVADVTVTEDADIGDWSGKQDITLRLLRAICQGVKAEPALNAWYDGPSCSRRLIETIDVAIAVDTTEGLFTPVLRDVANRNLADVREGLNRLKVDVLARSIPLEEMRGYSITLSNYGIWGGLYSDPIVAPPSVAILGAGRIRDRVVASEGKPLVRPVMPLSLTVDHRCVTGGEATRFLMTVVADLQAAA